MLKSSSTDVEHGLLVEFLCIVKTHFPSLKQVEAASGFVAFSENNNCEF